MRCAALFAALLPAFPLSAQPSPQPSEPNVIYGMYSGAALLMDVYRPATPNGYGVIFISGSGWHAPLDLSSQPLAKGGQTKMYAPPLLAAGYTVFSVTHRAAPRFRYPAAVEDAQRAVRFLRHNAQRFGINPDRIAAVGGSSGAHLSLMLGMLDGSGNPADADPINRVSAKVQCVVARAAPSDLSVMASRSGGAPAVTSFVGMVLQPGQSAATIETKTYRDASPIHHVSAGDPPTLLIHGDADDTVPYDQSEKMLAALKAAGVTGQLLRVPGGAHGPDFGKPANAPDYMGAMVQWLDTHLQRK